MITSGMGCNLQPCIGKGIRLSTGIVHCQKTKEDTNSVSYISWVNSLLVGHFITERSAQLPHTLAVRPSQSLKETLQTLISRMRFQVRDYTHRGHVWQISMLTISCMLLQQRGIQIAFVASSSLLNLQVIHWEWARASDSNSKAPHILHLTQILGI